MEKFKESLTFGHLFIMCNTLSVMWILTIIHYSFDLDLGRQSWYGFTLYVTYFILFCLSLVFTVYVIANSRWNTKVFKC